MLMVSVQEQALGPEKLFQPKIQLKSDDGVVGLFFVGVIDEVAIFNSILSEDDLQSIMERGLVKILGAESVLPTNLMTITWAELKNSSL